MAKVGRGARGARGVGGAAVGGGARIPLSGGRIPPSFIHGGESWWRRGGAPRRPLAVEPVRDGPRRRDTGGAGGAGHRGSGGLVPPWWLWAGAGETGRASGLRLVRGGVEGPGGLGGEPREAPGGWARAPEGGRSLRGGGGLLPARAAQGRRVVRCRGAAVWGGGRGAAVRGRAGVQRAAAQGCSVAPRRSAAWGRVRARHGAAQGRGVGLRRGAAWGCAGA